MDIIELTENKIDLGYNWRRMRAPGSGGNACFVGTTRDKSEGKKVAHLEYETYHSMAMKELRLVAKDMREKWPLMNVVLIHRIGIVPASEVSVLVAANAVHRKEAIEAINYGIEEIKERVPIWKKESYEDGTSNWMLNKPINKVIADYRNGVLHPCRPFP